MNDPCKFCGMPVDSNCPCWNDNEDSDVYDHNYDDEYDDYDDDYDYDDEYEEDE